MAQQHAFRGAAQRSEASEEGFFEGSLDSPGPGGYGSLTGTLSSGPGNEAGDPGSTGRLGTLDPDPVRHDGHEAGTFPRCHMDGHDLALCRDREMPLRAWDGGNPHGHLPGPQGHSSVPKNGEVVTVHVRSREDASFVPIMPNGIRIESPKPPR